jgi:hypothetical protein
LIGKQKFLACRGGVNHQLTIPARMVASLCARSYGRVEDCGSSPQQVTD